MLLKTGCFESPAPTLSNYVWVPYYVNDKMGCDLSTLVGTLEECGKRCDEDLECAGFVVSSLSSDTIEDRSSDDFEERYESAGGSYYEDNDFSETSTETDGTGKESTRYRCAFKKDFPYFSRMEDYSASEYSDDDVSFGEAPSSYLKVSVPSQDDNEDPARAEQNDEGEEYSYEEGSNLMSMEEDTEGDAESGEELMSIDSTLNTHRLFCSIQDLRLQSIPKVGTCAFSLKRKELDSSSRLGETINSLNRERKHKKFNLCFNQYQESCSEYKDGKRLYKTCPCDEIFLEQCAWYLRQNSGVEHPLNEILEAEYEEYEMCLYQGDEAYTENQEEYCRSRFFNQNALDRLEQQGIAPIYDEEYD